MKLLKDLIRIESSDTDGANRAVEFAAAYLAEHGIAGTILDNEGFKSYVAVVGEGERTLVLNGHLDVVSGTPSQFDPVEADGKISGRGSVDMKGGCVAMMRALIRLKDMAPGCKVMLQLVPDEETGGSKGTRFLVEKGYTGDFVICTEPTNLKISIQTKGIIVLDILSAGKSAHGSRPWEGENAILKSMENFSKVERLPILNIGSEFYERSSINLAKIQGGDIYNRVPDSCVIGLDIRFVPHLDPEEILSAIREAVDGEVVVKVREHGVNVDPESRAVGLLLETAAEVIPGEPPGLSAQHGGSDTRFFAARGIPAVEFGPRGAHWHGDGEYVETESLELLEEILVAFAMRFREL
jgi:succinyl-diaminopimelate desuccinylase